MLAALGVVGTALLVACSDDVASSDAPEEWRGELYVDPRRQSDPFQNPQTDTVVFTVDAGRYAVSHLTRRSGLCDSRGEVRRFGTNQMTLEPSGAVNPGGCDSLRIPRGEFKTVFRGDSLYAGPGTTVVVIQVGGFTYHDTMLYEFRLRER